MEQEQERESAFQRLRRLIQEEQDRTQQYAIRVRISPKMANDLAGMTTDDWVAASNGFSSRAVCSKLAGDFAQKGGAAANGFKISVVGPVLEVAEDLSAPNVEIIEGLPYES